MNYIIRRKKLGKSSCLGITQHMDSNIKILRNDKLIPNLDGYVFRWGCTSTLDSPSAKVINKPEAISFVNNKINFRKECIKQGISVPKTWFNLDEVPSNYYPVIVRPEKHSQGRKLYLCYNHDQISKAIAKCGERYYISQYVAKEKEYRVFVCQGRVVWVADKVPTDPSKVAWNVAQGGSTFVNVRWSEWPLKAVKLAIKAMNISGLDFGGVDVMVAKDGTPFIIEINSAPSQTSQYRQAAVGRVFDWVITCGKNRILVGDSGKYRRYIHPALDSAAIIGSDNNET